MHTNNDPRLERIDSNPMQALKELILGYEDPRTLEHVPGLRDRFELHERKDDERFKSLFLWFRIGAIPLIIVTADAVGVPTKDLGPLIQHIAKTVGTLFQ